MATKKKTWREKRDVARQPEVEILAKRFSDMEEGTHMLIASPLTLDAYIRALPRGTAVSMRSLRRDLAAPFNAENTCPLTIGIFLRIVAEAAYEELQAGTPLADITPFWRVIEPKSPLLKKLSFGAAFVQAQRKAEGLSL